MRRSNKQWENYKPDVKKIFVGGLPQNCTEDSLITFFAAFGDITACEIKMDPTTGASRGFAFVTFGEQEGAVAAVQILIISHCRRVVRKIENVERTRGNEIFSMMHSDFFNGFSLKSYGSFLKFLFIFFYFRGLKKGEALLQLEILRISSVMGLKFRWDSFLRTGHNFVIRNRAKKILAPLNS